jgi:hypothetical protein
MALEITGTIELSSGVVINSAYARVNPSLDTSGNRVFTSVNFWLSETDYDDNKWPLDYNAYTENRFDYDRTTDGNDILLFANEQIKSQLEAKGFSVTIIEL